MQKFYRYIVAFAVAGMFAAAPSVWAGKCCDAKRVPKPAPSSAVPSADKAGDKAANAGQASKAKATKTSGKLAKKEVKAPAPQN